MARKNRYKPRKDGRFYTQVGTGEYLPDGRPERIPLYSNISSKDLEDKVDALKASIKSGKYRKPVHITLGEYAETWYNTYKAQKSINTRAMYRNLLDAHIVPHFGHMELADIKRSDVQALITLTYSKVRTCEQISMALKQIFNSAVSDHYIVESPWNKIDMPKHKKSTRGRPLSELEKVALDKADFTLKQRAFLMLLFGCGVRRGEALAIHFNDIDVYNRVLYIRHVIVFDKNKPVLEERAKSDDGIREIPIPIFIFPLIVDYLEYVGRNIFSIRDEKLKAAKLDKLLLFPSSRGGYMSKSSYRSFFNGILDKMNESVSTKLDPRPISITAHIFRHNYCTMLYYSGISELKAVELMGHSDSTMIHEVYSHLDEIKENTIYKLDTNIKLTVNAPQEKAANF